MRAPARPWADDVVRRTRSTALVMTLPHMVEHGLGPVPGASPVSVLLKGVVLLGFLGLWMLAARLAQAYQLFNPVFLPSPEVVLWQLVDMARTHQLEVHVMATLQRVAIGFSSAALLAVSLGMLAGHWSWLRHVLEPIIEVVRPIPPLALLPLFIVWIGIGEASKVAFITYATFFPMFMTTLHAVLHVDPVLQRAAASLGASQTQQFWQVLLPAALPHILTGWRLGVALAFFVIVISEFIGAEHGLGYLINDGRNFFLVPQMLAAAVVLGFLGYAGNALLQRLEHRLLRWRQP